MYLFVTIAGRYACRFIDSNDLRTFFAQVVSACVANRANDVAVQLFHLLPFFQFLESCKQHLLHNIFCILTLPDSNIGKTK